MSLYYEPIFTRTIATGETTGSVIFNNIPQTFRDLKIVASIRTAPTAYREDAVGTAFNGNNQTLYSRTGFYWDGGGSTAERQSNQTNIALLLAPTSLTAANTFSSGEIYIPNYTSSNFKSMYSVISCEDAAATILSRSMAVTWRNTAAITSINFTSANYVAGTTFTIYGIQSVV
jgi:hypothetical protein